jgi:hypothetical protein
MSKIQNERNSVLLELLTNKAVRNDHSWKWLNKRKGLPSLRNEITSSLFRADLVRELSQEMILSEWGRVIVKKLQEEENT